MQGQGFGCRARHLRVLGSGFPGLGFKGLGFKGLGVKGLRSSA